MPPVVLIPLDGVRPDALTTASRPALNSICDEGDSPIHYPGLWKSCMRRRSVVSHPWMAVGPRIKKGYTIQSEITLLDTAPTVARIMGRQAHDEWEGRSADEIFQ